jgi:hypothetical protein
MPNPSATTHVISNPNPGRLNLIWKFYLPKKIWKFDVLEKFKDFVHRVPVSMSLRALFKHPITLMPRNAVCSQ